MIEIIAGVWLGSFVLSALLTASNIGSVFRATRNPRYLLLNSNLQKWGLFWSLSSEDFQALGEMNPQEDARKLRRNFLIMGGLGFLSFPGFFFLAVITASMRFLKGRKSQRVFRSDLAHAPDLDAAKVKVLIDEINALGR